MTITWNLIFKIFYYITVAIMTLGVIMNIIDNNVDIYQVWVVIAMYAAVYLIEKK